MQAAIPYCLIRCDAGHDDALCNIGVVAVVRSELVVQIEGSTFLPAMTSEADNSKPWDANALAEIVQRLIVERLSGTKGNDLPLILANVSRELRGAVQFSSFGSLHAASQQQVESAGAIADVLMDRFVRSSAAVPWITGYDIVHPADEPTTSAAPVVLQRSRYN